MFKQDLQMFGLKLNKYGTINPLEVLARCSERQLQAGGILKYLP